MISKQQYEAQLQQIFRLLLENKSQEVIARELNISTRSVGDILNALKTGMEKFKDKRHLIQSFWNHNSLKIDCSISIKY